MNPTEFPQDEYILEVIATSVEDAVNAELGGAHRLELVRELDAGGLTPSLDFVSEVCEKVQLPVRVMLRENAGYGLSETIALDKLHCVAAALKEMKVDGIVIGFLIDGLPDIVLTSNILSKAPDLKATFHHAFEDADDKRTMIEALKGISNIDRILAHGGPGNIEERAANLARYAAASSPEIKVIAGGGVDLGNIRTIRDRTGIREFHVGRAARADGKVSVEQVRRLAAELRQSL